MMTEQTLIQEVHTLSESLKQEVLHYVRFLKQKQNIQPVYPKLAES